MQDLQPLLNQQEKEHAHAIAAWYHLSLDLFRKSWHHRTMSFQESQKQNYQKLSDQHLLELYKKSDALAFEVFYKRHQQLIYNFLYSRARNSADADESFQETWLRVHKYVLSFDAKQNAVAWILQIARNTLIDLLRKKSRAGTLLERPPETAVDNTPQHEARLIVTRLLNNLDPQDASLIKQRYLEEKDYEEIAKSEEISEVNTRQKISRLMRKLRKMS